MVALGTLKAPQMQPQYHGTLQDGQVAKASRPAILDVRAARLASRTHDRGLASLEMQLQLLGADDLIDNAKFWQTEQGFNTIDVHEQDSSFWGDGFPTLCEESCTCQDLL
jgi:hypothetical protein